VPRYGLLCTGACVCLRLNVMGRARRVSCAQVRWGGRKCAYPAAACNAQHSAARHRAAQRSAAQRSTAQHGTARHSTGQCSAAQRSTGQCSTGQCSTAQCNAAQHSTAQGSAARHGTAPVCHPPACLHMLLLMMLTAVAVSVWRVDTYLHAWCAPTCAHTHAQAWRSYRFRLRTARQTLHCTARTGRR
jgi:hypothetical protein